MNCNLNRGGPRISTSCANELHGLRLESELPTGAQVFLAQVEVAGAASGSGRQVSRRESALEPASTARIVGRLTGAKTNPRIRTILNGRDSDWFGLPFAPLIDIRVIIPSHRWLGGTFSPWLALDRKE